MHPLTPFLAADLDRERRAAAARRSLARRARAADEERGPESYELIVRLGAGHDRFHLAQAERALAAVRGG